METVNQNQQQVPVKLMLSERSKATIKRIKTEQAEAEQVKDQKAKVDKLIDDTYSEIDLLKVKPCVPSIADQVDSLLDGILDLPSVDANSELQREAQLKQKQDLLDGLTQRRKELIGEQNRLYSRFLSDELNLSDALLEDWVGSLSDQDSSIFFTVLEKYRNATTNGHHSLPFIDKRPVEYAKKATESLNSMAALENEKS